MKRSYRYWKYFLPVAQLLLALFGSVYGPRQYKAELVANRVSGDNNVLEYFFQHYPATVERISSGINFPAMVLAFPFRDSHSVIYERSIGQLLIWISPKEISFFVAILVFWYWVGSKLDRRKDGRTRDSSARITKVAELVCVFTFAVLTAAYAIQLITSEWMPYRQIGMFGIPWSLVLLSYFGWSLRRQWNSHKLSNATQ